MGTEPVPKPPPSTFRIWTIYAVLLVIFAYGGPDGLRKIGMMSAP